MCCGLGQGGRNCLKYFKWGWNRKEGSRSNDFKKEGQAGSTDGGLKKGGGGLESPKKTMMFTSTLLQGFFTFIYYLFHIVHCYLAIT